MLPFELLTCDLTETQPRSMAEQPLDRCNKQSVASLVGVGGGESHQSGVPSRLTANLADPARLRDTIHAPRRTARTPTLMSGA